MKIFLCPSLLYKYRILVIRETIHVELDHFYFILFGETANHQFSRRHQTRIGILSHLFLLFTLIRKLYMRINVNYLGETLNIRFTYIIMKKL